MMEASVHVLLDPPQKVAVWAVQVVPGFRHVQLERHTRKLELELIAIKHILRMVPGPCKITVSEDTHQLVSNKRRASTSERRMLGEVLKLKEGRTVEFLPGVAHADLIPLARHKLQVHEGSKHHLQLYTDGSIVDRHLGGWAYWLDDSTHGSGFQPFSTVNRMELTAILEGLKAVPMGSRVVVHTDSLMCVGWLQMGWKAQVPDVLNLIHRIQQTVQKRGLKVRFEKIAGHQGHRGFDGCDRQAKAAARSLQGRPLRTRKPEVTV